MNFPYRNELFSAFYKKVFYQYMVLVLSLLLFGSCNKLVDVPGPITSTNTDNVYLSDATAISVLNGIYINMSSNKLIDGNYLNSFMPLYAGLAADEYTLFANASENLFTFYRNIQTNTTTPNALDNTYPIIFTANSAIEGLNSSESLTPFVKTQLLGEAKFIRAFCYFYLVNLYGDIPLALTSDYKINSSLSRASVETVQQQIINDLIDADTLLSSDYVDLKSLNPTNERIAPIKWAAVALLSRAYLYKGDYAMAEKFSTQVIQNSGLYNLENLNNVFKSNSSEAIWQLQPVNSGWNTEDAKLFILPESGPSSDWPVYLSPDLLSSFELGDNRRVEWVDSVNTTNGKTFYFPYKYKVASQDADVSEYQMVLRLSEQYLIRAEARAQLANLNGAISDLDVIRNRAGLKEYSGAISKEAVIDAILHERQVELFSEWGHRWLDLKRSNTIDAVMDIASQHKGGTWKSTAQLFPISEYDLRYNKNLTQNEGY